MITPYSRRGVLTPSQRVFNYRQSRARRIIECSFGLLKSKWSVYEKPIGLQVDATEKVILATLCLHNFLITLELNLEEHARRYVINHDDVEIEDDDHEVPQVPVNNGYNIRESLKNYFCEPNGPGEVDFQYERI